MKGKRKAHKDQVKSAGARSKKTKLEDSSVLEEDSNSKPAQDCVDATQTAENATNATGDHGIEHSKAGVEHSTGSVEHSTTSVEHTYTAGEEKSTTGEEHSTASLEHSTAGIEHSTAGDEHSTASVEHSTAGEEQSTAGLEQSTAGVEHSTASDKYSTVSVEHSTANEEKSTAIVEDSTADAQRETEVSPKPKTEIPNKVDNRGQLDIDKTKSDSFSVEKINIVVDGDESNVAEAINIDAAEYESEAKAPKNKQEVNTDATVEEGSQESPAERKHNPPSGVNRTLETVAKNLDMIVATEGDQAKGKSNQTTGRTDINKGSADEAPDTDQAAQETHDGSTSDERCTDKLAESATTVNEATVDGNAVEKGYPRCDAEVLDLGCQDVDDVTTVGDDITDSQLCALDWSSQWPNHAPSSGHGCSETRTSDPSTEDLVVENDQLENATAVVITLVKELQNMNRSLLKTKREIEAARRQRMH